uniref:Uncharacterized protein n=1 Tax=Arundo donax TaxID=35708 RepID=A0A0A9DS31_ARUDO
MGRHPRLRPLYISIHPSPVSPQTLRIFPSSSCRHNDSTLLVFLHRFSVQLHRRRTVLMEMLEPVPSRGGRESSGRAATRWR